jgi:hypothetical protein
MRSPGRARTTSPTARSSVRTSTQALPTRREARSGCRLSSRRTSLRAQADGDQRGYRGGTEDDHGQRAAKPGCPRLPRPAERCTRAHRATDRSTRPEP